jgi:hypothetical protein
LAVELLYHNRAVDQIPKICEESEMAIQKKSLISNRTATKKALVAKPEVSAAAPTRMKVPAAHMKVPAAHMKVPAAHMKVPAAHMKVPAAHMKVPAAHIKTSF